MPFFTAGNQVDNSAILNNALSVGEGVLESATNQALGRLQQGLSRIAGVAANEAQKFDQEQERKAIEQGVIDGKISPNQFSIDKLEGDDVYSRAVNKTRESGLASNILRKATVDSAILADRYKNDIDGFKGAMDALQVDLLATSDDSDFAKDAISNAVSDQYSRYLPSVTVNSYNAIKQAEKENYSAILKTEVNSFFNDVRTGNDEILEVTLGRIETTIRSGVEAGVYGSLPDPDTNPTRYKAAVQDLTDKVVREVSLEAQEQFAKGVAEREIEKGNYAGARRAIKSWREEQEADKVNPYSPDELDAIQRQSEQKINQAESAAARQFAKGKKERERLVKEQGQITVVKNYLTAGIPLSQSKESQNAVDTYFTQNFASTIVDNPEALVEQAKFITDTGVLPTRVKENMQVAIVGKNTAVTQAYSDLFTNIQANNRKVTAQFDSDTQAYLGTYARQVRAGFTPEEAIENANDIVFNVNPERAEVLKNRTKRSDYISDRSENAISYVDSLTTLSEDDIDLEQATPSNIEFESDWNVAYDAAFQKTGGDAEQANLMASSVVARKWATTSINGTKQLMRFSPEAVYGGQGDTQWLNNQWKKDQSDLSRQAFGGLPEGSSLVLISDRKTEREDKPSYAVMIRTEDANGFSNLQPFYGTDNIAARWLPDFNKSEEYLNIIEERDQAFTDAKDKRAMRALGTTDDEIEQDVLSQLPIGLMRGF